MFFAVNMLAFLLLPSTFSAPPADAVKNPEPQNYLQQAQQAYAALRFDDCRILLDRALRKPDNSREGLVKIYRLRGLVEAAMGQPIAAKRAFANMIVLEPKASLKDDYAPKIMRTYEAARASLPGEKGLRISGLGDEQILMGQDAQIAIRVDDTLAMVEQLVVRFRVDKGPFQQRILTRADHGLLRLSADLLPARELVYQLEVEAKAQNAYGATLAELQPHLHIQVVTEIAEDELPLYRQWVVVGWAECRYWSHGHCRCCDGFDSDAPRYTPQRCAGRAAMKNKLFYSAITSLALSLLLACSQQDQVRLRFENNVDKEEAQLVIINAIASLTTAGQVITCDDYPWHDHDIDMDDLDVVKSSSVDVEQQQSAPSLLVQLPQGPYLFVAEAQDTFGFIVARGCSAARFEANSPLKLDILLQSVIAPSGRLTSLGPQSWLQHAGVAALRGAPNISVQTLNEQGQPAADIEIRLRVISGEAVPLNMNMRSDAQGYASTQVLVSSGPVQLQIHARGLQGSPLTISITGLPSPEYSVLDRDLGGKGVALLAENFHFDEFASTDVLAVSQQHGAGEASIWRAAPDSQGLWYEQWHDLDDVPTQAVAGQLDLDMRPDLVVAASGETGSTLKIYHHDQVDGDSFKGPVAEILPADVDSVLQMAAGYCGGPAEGQDLFAIVEANEQRDLLLWHNVGSSDSINLPVLVLVQRRALPSFASDARMSLADLDGDGDDDLLLESTFSGVWIVPCGMDSTGQGTGQFFAPTEIGRSDWPHILTQPGTNSVSAGDVNADSYTDSILVSDMVVLEGDVSWRVALGDGRLAGFHFSAPTSLPLPGAVQTLLVDANADGFLDLLIAGRRPPEQWALLGGDGRGNFAAPLILDTGLSNVHIVSADLNLDGIADIEVLGETLEGP